MYNTMSYQQSYQQSNNYQHSYAEEPNVFDDPFQYNQTIAQPHQPYQQQAQNYYRQPSFSDAQYTNAYPSQYDQYNAGPYYDNTQYKEPSPKQVWTQIEDKELDALFNAPSQPKVVPKATANTNNSMDFKPIPRTRTRSNSSPSAFGHPQESLKQASSKVRGIAPGAVSEAPTMRRSTTAFLDEAHVNTPTETRRFTFKCSYDDNNVYNIDILDADKSRVSRARLVLYSRIKMLDRNDKVTLFITREELHMRPTYAVQSNNGICMGVCTQRIKIGTVNKKFNYKLSNNTVLKMTGSYNGDFEIKKNGIVVATVHKGKNNGFDVNIRPNKTRDEHVFAMVLILLEKKFTKELK
ncbi:hypothetical protein AKO1_001107 [Acrasis kona]|uniref:Phospholipid scramblase n=1 Tax=Acrasis kona TaxID=1008807 RepID=A0AAW2ZEQ2_9EUKA